MSVISADVVNVTYDAEVNAVVFVWATTPTSQEFREALNYGLSLVSEKQAKRWIGDTRNIGAIDPEDQQWSNEDWFPRALGAGIVDMGVIVSNDIFSKMSVEEIMGNVGGSEGFESRFFSSVEDAKAWFKSK